MFREDGFRPSDQRGFLHKSFIGRAVGGVVKRFVPAVGIASDIVGSFTSKRAARPVRPRTLTARPTLEGQRGKELGRSLKLSDAVPFTTPTRPLTTARLPAVASARLPCLPGFHRHTPGGTCFHVGKPHPFADEEAVTTAVGDAVMGQYGAALEPGTMMIERSICIPGMQLAKDGLCYNKGAITNSQRMWPRGRRPLLTGGDMRAIGIAARAGAKLDRTTKRLRALGMMKKLPSPRKAAPHQHAKALSAVSIP